MNKKEKILSVLIPAYCYSQGVENILGRLDQIPADVEILIFDDSPTNCIFKLVRRYQVNSPQIFYRHNVSMLGRPLGAAGNWNALLDHATGKYVMLMHHDEMPLGKKFLPELRSSLFAADAPDVLVLNHYIYNVSGKRLREHIPSWFRRVILKHALGYLFRRNVIGPTACVVARREVVPRFDPELIWLIDVDFFYRLLCKKLRWVVAPNLSVASQSRVNGSITAAISSNLNAIDGYERKYLARLHVEARIWLHSGGWVPVRWVEAFAWVLFRGYSFLFRTLKNNNGRRR